MERHLKERLIGATVLVAATIILVPEMLSGPGEARRASPVAESVKTYSVDLKPATAPALPPVQPPNGEATTELAAEPPPAVVPEIPAQEQPPVPAPEPLPPTSETAPAEAQPAGEAASQPEAVPVPSPTPAASGAWAIQVGSFSTKAKATTVARDLERQGFPSFVRATTLGGKTLYRVRVGPLAERSAAETMLAKVRARSSGAAIVRNGD